MRAWKKLLPAGLTFLTGSRQSDVSLDARRARGLAHLVRSNRVTRDAAHGRHAFVFVLGRIHDSHNEPNYVGHFQEASWSLVFWSATYN